MSNKQPLRKSFLGDWKVLIEPRTEPEIIAEDMQSSASPKLSFFVLLGLSTTIATFGLIANSAPAIIGAMIIAPLMNPIMGLSYGFIQLDWGQILRSVTTLVLGVLVVIAISFVSTRVIEIKVTGSEMLSRAFPSLLDLGVAMASGAAGAFALSRESIRSSIAGVAISVSLVPPLAVAGIGLALGAKATADVGISFHEFGMFDRGSDIAVGAAVLFLTNLAAIVVVAGTVMTIQGYARWARGFIGLICVMVASYALVQPLSQELEKLQIKSAVMRLAKTLPEAEPDHFINTLQLATLRVRVEDDIYYVHGEGVMPRDKVEGAQARLEFFQRALQEKIGEPVIMEMEVTPVDLVQIRAAPDEK